MEALLDLKRQYDELVSELKCTLVQIEYIKREIYKVKQIALSKYEVDLAHLIEVNNGNYN